MIFGSFVKAVVCAIRMRMCVSISGFTIQIKTKLQTKTKAQDNYATRQWRWERNCFCDNVSCKIVTVNTRIISERNFVFATLRSHWLIVV